jgi:hypothetical protein
MAARFSPDLLARLAAAEEVEIETRMGDAAPAHRTIIWIVVDAAGHVLVRTFLGPGSRWYREIRVRPDCVLHLGDLAVPVTAVPAVRRSLVAACSHGYRQKYAAHRATARMLAAENLPTTLQLLAR